VRHRVVLPPACETQSSSCILFTLPNFDFRAGICSPLRTFEGNLNLKYNEM
jgi:hypothetical protein